MPWGGVMGSGFNIERAVSIRNRVRRHLRRLDDAEPGASLDTEQLLGRLARVDRRSLKLSLQIAAREGLIVGSSDGWRDSERA